MNKLTLNKPAINETYYLLQVVARDDDLGLYGQVRYSMGSDGAEYFTINEITGEVTTLVDFDREVPITGAIIVSGNVINMTLLYLNVHISIIQIVNVSNQDIKPIYFMN